MDTAQLVAGATFIGVLALVVGPYLLFVVRPELMSQDMLRRRIRTGGAAVRSTEGGLLKQAELLSVFGPLNRFLAGDSRPAVGLRNTIQMSGVKVTGGQLVLGSACLTLLAYMLMFWRLPSVLLAAVVGLIAGCLPYVTLKMIETRRLGKFEEQFPEAVDLISRTLRAGHAFPTGLRMAAEELPEPVSTEFRVLYEQQNFGLPIADGLKAFAKRVPLIDARFFVTAVLTQREAGGNLAEVLDNLSAVIRERFKIKRQLRVISAHGRMTGAVLAALPPALGGFLLFSNPEHFRVLTEDPAGIRMVGVAVALQALGALLIYKITKVDY